MGRNCPHPFVVAPSLMLASLYAVLLYQETHRLVNGQVQAVVKA